ncbi:MAG: hypothetical protein HQL26_10405 [Candidatus Omnitrophica bacterium]|nr:hypothetical protein [Candidatus Omnitrophota bacterium]
MTRNKKGQIAIVLLLVCAMALIFYAAVLNIQKAGENKMGLSTAGALSATTMSSELGSYGQQLFKEQMGGKMQICKGSWFALFELFIGPPTPGFLINLQITQPKITSSWNKMMSKKSSQVDQFSEAGLQVAMQGLVNDTKEVPDLLDLNDDGFYGFDDKGNPKDKISRYTYYYTQRVRPTKKDKSSGNTDTLADNTDVVTMNVPFVMKKFQNELADFLYDNPNGLTDQLQDDPLCRAQPFVYVDSSKKDICGNDYGITESAVEDQKKNTAANPAYDEDYRKKCPQRQKDHWALFDPVPVRPCVYSDKSTVVPVDENVNSENLNYADAEVPYSYPVTDLSHVCHSQGDKDADKNIPAECNPCCVPPDLQPLANGKTANLLPDCCNCAATAPRPEYLLDGELCQAYVSAGGKPENCPKDPQSCDGTFGSSGGSALQCGSTSTCDFNSPYASFNPFSQANYPFVYNAALDDWKKYSDGVNWTQFDWANYDWVGNDSLPNEQDKRTFVFTKLFGADDRNKNYFRDPRLVSDYFAHPQEVPHTCGFQGFRIEDTTGYQTDVRLFPAKDQKPGFIFPFLYKISDWGLDLSNLHPEAANKDPINFPSSASSLKADPLYNYYHKYWEGAEDQISPNVPRDVTNVDVTNAAFHQNYINAPEGKEYILALDQWLDSRNVLDQDSRRIIENNFSRYISAQCADYQVNRFTCSGAGMVIKDQNDNDLPVAPGLMNNDPCQRKNNRVCDEDLCLTAAGTNVSWDDREDCYGNNYDYKLNDGVSTDANGPYTQNNPYAQEEAKYKWDNLFPPELEGRWVLPNRKINSDTARRVIYGYDGTTMSKTTALYVNLKYGSNVIDGIDKNLPGSPAALDLVTVQGNPVNLVAKEDILNLRAPTQEAECAEGAIYDNADIGMWRKGWDQYCSVEYPYDQHCDKNKPQPWAMSLLKEDPLNSCAYTQDTASAEDPVIDVSNPLDLTGVPGNAANDNTSAQGPQVNASQDCSCAAKEVDKEDFPDDVLDRVQDQVHEFIVWAQGIVNTNPTELADTFGEWYYPAAAYLFEAAASCEKGNPYCSPCDTKISDADILANKKVQDQHYLCYANTNLSPGGGMHYWLNAFRMTRDRIQKFIDHKSVTPDDNCYQAFCAPSQTCMDKAGFYINDAEKQILNSNTGLDQTLECLNWNANDAVSWREDTFPISSERKEASWPRDEKGLFDTKGDAVKFYTCGQTCSAEYCGNASSPLPRSIVPDYDPGEYVRNPGKSQDPYLSILLNCWDSCDSTACNAAANQLDPNWSGYSQMIESGRLDLLPNDVLKLQAMANNIRNNPYFSLWSASGNVVENTVKGVLFPRLVSWKTDGSECLRAPNPDISGENVILTGAGLSPTSSWYNAIVNSMKLAGGDMCDPSPSGWLGKTRQSAVEAENQVVKMRRRLDFLNKRKHEAEYIRDNIIGQDYTSQTAKTDQAKGILWHVGKFLSCDKDPLSGEYVGPACNLIKARHQFDYIGKPLSAANGSGGLGDSKSGTKTSNPKYTTDIIYGWRSEGTKKNGKDQKDGRWHIVRAQVWMPQKGMSQKWPWVKTWTKLFNTTRCFAMWDHSSTVYSRVSRWDESSPGGLTFPNGVRLWDFRYGGGSKKKADDIENVCNTDGEDNPLYQIYKGKAGSYYTTDQLKDTLDGAFFLNNDGKDKKDCVALAKDLLDLGTEENTCSAYKLSSGGYKLSLKTGCKK